VTAHIQHAWSTGRVETIRERRRDRASPGSVPSGLAILLAMTASVEHMPLADVKNRLSEVVERLEREHGRVVITKHGRPAAVVLSVEDLEGLEQTLEILSDPRAMRRIRKARAEISASEAEELTKEQALALVRRK
jgi:antitoxin YefM